MHKFSVSFLLLLAAWLLMTGAPTRLELIVGITASILIAHLCGKFIFYESPYQLFNPRSIINLAIYSIILLGAEIKSHITTASAIITGSINPAIIKIPTTQTTDFTKTLVANSITITPGTLTVKIDKNHQDLYIHCLNYSPKKDISTQFEKHAKNVIS
ncbi:MAG: Na+/H+ antiporter subunit E [Candidatus Aenigmarchaeota archaeon]|nr:Na+/H+ antiporter subunit E [Candidatus Aenigmarchaeota archaeon]